MARKRTKRTLSKPVPSEVKELLPSPSLDELIAEARALGEDDMADAMERIKHLETPRDFESSEKHRSSLKR